MAKMVKSFKRWSAIALRRWVYIVFSLEKDRSQFACEIDIMMTLLNIPNVYGDANDNKFDRFKKSITSAVVLNWSMDLITTNLFSPDLDPYQYDEKIIDYVRIQKMFTFWINSMKILFTKNKVLRENRSFIPPLMQSINGRYIRFRKSDDANISARYSSVIGIIETQ